MNGVLLNLGLMSAPLSVYHSWGINLHVLTAVLNIKTALIHYFDPPLHLS